MGRHLRLLEKGLLVAGVGQGDIFREEILARTAPPDVTGRGVAEAVGPKGRRVRLVRLVARLGAAGLVEGLAAFPRLVPLARPAGRPKVVALVVDPGDNVVLAVGNVAAPPFSLAVGPTAASAFGLLAYEVEGVGRPGVPVTETAKVAVGLAFLTAFRPRKPPAVETPPLTTAARVQRLGLAVVAFDTEMGRHGERPRRVLRLVATRRADLAANASLADGVATSGAEGEEAVRPDVDTVEAEEVAPVVGLQATGLADGLDTPVRPVADATA